MSDTHRFGDDLDLEPRGSRLVEGDELLPPVEPPSASFILQLFIVPALIVLVIVAVWLLFSWLVHRATTGPEKLVERLQDGASVARWQRASELADMLRNDRFPEYRQNSAAATRLAAVLEREIDGADSGGGMQEGDVTLRYFITRALGEFQVNEGIDVLLKAATTARDPAEQIVRRGALQAIAVRAYHLQELEPPQALEHPELESTLAALAGDEDPLIRSAVAYALGQLATPSGLDRLSLMVDDPHPDTRYNAAVALAHQGRAEGIETLAEMLDVEELASVREEPNEQNRAFKRTLIISTALKAAEDLARQNPTADLAPVRESLEGILEADGAARQRAMIPAGATSEVRRVLALLEERDAAQASEPPLTPARSAGG